MPEASPGPGRGVGLEELRCCAGSVLLQGQAGGHASPGAPWAAHTHSLSTFWGAEPGPSGPPAACTGVGLRPRVFIA